jgi:hygromycin-B 4-O-kinase
VTEAFEAQVPRCPETRRLVHGDFGSNNVLYADGRITAVLDWDSAKYGDPLLDIAGAYYWRTWLACMEALAAYSEERLGGLPNYRARIECYQLRVGLDEIYVHAAAGNRPELDWHQQRCVEILGAL